LLEKNNPVQHVYNYVLICVIILEK